MSQYFHTCSANHLKNHHNEYTVPVECLGMNNTEYEKSRVGITNNEPKIKSGLLLDTRSQVMPTVSVQQFSLAVVKATAHTNHVAQS